MSEQSSQSETSSGESALDAYEQWRLEGQHPSSIMVRTMMAIAALLVLLWVIVDLWPAGPISPPEAYTTQSDIYTTARQRRVPMEPVRNRMQELQVLNANERERIREMVGFIDALVKARSIVRSQGVWVSSDDVLVSIAESLEVGANEQAIARIFTRVDVGNRTLAFTHLTRFLQEGQSPTRAASQAISVANTQGGGA